MNNINNINFNLYKNFYEVAKAGSITEAANNTFVSQPAISKSIKKLEDELGIKLFIRNPNGTILTEKGRELFFYVEEAFNNLVTANRRMLEVENLEKGKISIGVPSQIAAFYLFDNIENFHNMYPNIEITIISKSTSQLLSLLKNHEIDFMIDTAPTNTGYLNCVVKPLIEISNCFVTKRRSKFDNNDIKSLKDLENIPLILPIEGTANRNVLNSLFNKNRVNPTNIINIHTTEMIIGAIRKDMGIGYVIYDTIKNEISDSEFKIINVKEELPKTAINLVYIKQYLTTAPLKFIQKYIDNTIEL